MLLQPQLYTKQIIDYCNDRLIGKKIVFEINYDIHIHNVYLIVKNAILQIV